MPSQLGRVFTLGVGARKAHAVPSDEAGLPSRLSGEHNRAPPPSGPPPELAEHGQDLHEDSEDDEHLDDHYSGEEPTDWLSAFFINFLGNASPRYKLFVLIALAINPFILLLPNGKVVAGWFVLVEFLGTLAASLQAYPLQAGGLLLVEANLMGITSPGTLLKEVKLNLNVILMLIFMVAAIHFLKNMLLWIFTNLLIKIENKVLLSITFMVSSAIMSAFLDALTVTAVIISVCTGFLGVYYYVEKNSFLPLLSAKGRTEISYELVPAARSDGAGLPDKAQLLSRARSACVRADHARACVRACARVCMCAGHDAVADFELVLAASVHVTPAEMEDILDNRRRHSSSDASDFTSPFDGGLGGTPAAGGRLSLDLRRRTSAEMAAPWRRRASTELPRGRASKSPGAGARSSLDVLRQRSEEHRSSLDFARHRAQQRRKQSRSLERRQGAVPAATARAEARVPEGQFTDLEAGAGVGDAASGSRETLGGSHEGQEGQGHQGSTDHPLPSSEEHNLAQQARLPDGSFAVPKLSQVLSKRIVQPKLPDSCGDDEMDGNVRHLERDVNQFQAFLRSIVMHAAVGTTVGGIATMVGEPQNLIVAQRMGWNFGGFIYQMLPVTLTVLPSALAVLVAVEKTGRFGYGAQMPEEVRWVLADFADKEFGRMKLLDKTKLVVQVIGALVLVVGLVLHIAEVGFIGLMIVVVLTAFNGITVEHEIAHAFLESMPFVSLLVVFLGIVGLIHDQHLFEPIIESVLALQDKSQLGVLFLVNGVLSAVSDNVFVATVFVEQLEKAFVVRSSGGDAWVNQTSGMPCSSQIDAQACNEAVKLQYDRLGAE